VIWTSTKLQVSSGHKDVQKKKDQEGRGEVGAGRNAKKRPAQDSCFTTVPGSR